MRARRDVVDSDKALITSLQLMVASSRKLPGGEDLDLDDRDLETLAERELDAVARAIAEATQRVAAARSNAEAEAKGISIQENQLHQAILEAARSIGKAMGELVRCATAAQKELAAAGKVNKAGNPYKKDPAWANGFISAAKTIAGATEDLVSVANDAANKKLSDEHLIAAARAVAGATARFMYSSKVKMDPSADTTMRLESASKATAAATTQLVLAAKQAAIRNAEERARKEVDEQSRAGAAGRKLEFEIQVEIARLEKALEAARQHLAEARRSEYTKQAAEGLL